MEKFETYLRKATAKGANAVSGAVMAVVDNDAGYNGVTEEAEPLEFDQTFSIASCTKLITSIATLQCVERGLITLDEPIAKHLPELASQFIVDQEGSEIKLRRATKSITLRRLITHSSGATYDWLSPKLHAWRASRGEAPTVVTNGDIAKGYAYPRTFESGEGWMYSSGMDWASLLVERLTNVNFEEYVETNLAKPLGITTFTWHLPRKPVVEENLMRMSTRQEDGTLTDGPTPLCAEPKKECGGLGMYANATDFTRVLSDLLKDSPILLQKPTVDQMFSPQFSRTTPATKALLENAQVYDCTLAGSMDGVKPNFGLGSLLLMEDVKRKNYFKPKNTLSWYGAGGLLWSVNRERGLALLFATQMLPWKDRKTWDLAARFETAVWRDLKA